MKRWINKKEERNKGGIKENKKMMVLKRNERNERELKGAKEIVKRNERK
jgi:hypothetical protein